MKEVNFWKRVTEQGLCILSFSVIISKFVLPKKTERDMIKRVYWSSRKVIIIVVLSWWRFNFLEGFPKLIKYLISLRFFRCEQIYSTEQTDVRTEGQWKIKKVTVVYLNFLITEWTDGYPYRQTDWNSLPNTRQYAVYNYENEPYLWSMRRCSV
jgi:hypothetical protein